eukprot:1160281-Amphidinium_carterae.2
MVLIKSNRTHAFVKDGTALQSVPQNPQSSVSEWVWRTNLQKKADGGDMLTRGVAVPEVGLVVPDFVRIPGEAYSFEAVPRAIDAHDALNADA